MAGHRVGQLGRVVDLVDGDQDFGGDFLVELDIALELADHGAGQRLGLLGLAGLFGQQLGHGLEVILGFLEAADLRATAALDQHLDRAIGQLEQLQHRGDGADLVQILGAGIVLGGVFLRDEEDLLVVAHHRFECAHGFIPADKERHNHVREDHDIAQRQHREQIAAFKFRHMTSLRTVGVGFAQKRHEARRHSVA